MLHPLTRSRCHPSRGQRFFVNKEEYELEGELGDGAAGVVRRVRRLRDGAKRAVKFLAPDPKYIDPEVFDDVAARFRREGQRGPFLDHPSLVKVYAFVENEGGAAFSGGLPKNPFILMQAFAGHTLEGYIRKLARRHNEKGEPATFSADPERISIAISVASALAYLHAKHLVHRDVKPANVFLPTRPKQEAALEAVLGDFGIMKWGDFRASLSSGTLTATAQQGLGTLKYMSPEQAVRPKDVTVRSDIFSFGITLFELFTTQILASAHHVFEIYAARASRGNTWTRFNSMGYKISEEDQGLGELVLDMHLRGAEGRPAIDKLRGRLIWEYERRADEAWEAP
jgi:serine/threonine-protein kinase